SVDITTICQSWVNGTLDNNGLMLRMGIVGLMGVTQLSFASSDYADSTKWPYLEITYELPTTEIKAGDCGATDVLFDRILKAIQFTGADKYQFHVFNQSGFDEILTKPASAFSLNELTGQVEYNTTYSVEVRMIFQNDTSDWGDTCAITTVNHLPGQSCESAIYEPIKLPEDIPSLHYFSTNSDYWFKFVTDTSAVSIAIQVTDTFPLASIGYYEIYTGSCNNLKLINATLGLGDLGINLYELTEGDTCYIKVIQQNQSYGFMSILISRFPGFHVHGWDLDPTECLNTSPCNEFINGDFSDHDPTIDLTAYVTFNGAFQWIDSQSNMRFVRGWGCLWGSVPLLIEFPPTSPFDRVAHLGSREQPTYHLRMGITTCVDLNAGDEYLLSFNIRRNTYNPQFPILPNLDVYYGFTSYNQYQSDYLQSPVFSHNLIPMGIPGGWYFDLPGIFPAGYQLFPQITTFDNPNWERFVTCFEADQNWERFVFFSKSENMEAHYLNADDFSLIPLRCTVNGSTQPNVVVCSDIFLGLECEASVNALALNNLWWTWHVTPPVGNTYTLSPDVNQTILSAAPGNWTFTLQMEFDDDQGVHHDCMLNTINANVLDAPPITFSTFNNGPMCFYGPGVILQVYNIQGGCTSSLHYNYTLINNSTGSIVASGSIPSSSYNFNITGVLNGNYTLTITDDCGCFEFEIIDIGLYPEIFVNSTTTPSCSSPCNGTATIVVTGGTPDYSYFITGPLGYSFSYTPPPSAPNPITLSGLCPGNYNYTIVDANSCIVNGTFTIVDGTLVIEVANNTPLIPCSGCCWGDITVSVFNGTPNYTFDIGVQSQTTSLNSFSFVDLCPTGLYTVIVTDDNGCTATEDFSINYFPTVPNIEIIEPTECIYNGENLTFSANILNIPFPNAQFEWDFGDGTPTVLSDPGQPVQHTYNVGNDYGYYCVSVSLFTCCTQIFTSFTDIYVLPDACACDQNINPAGVQAYDFSGTTFLPSQNNFWNHQFYPVGTVYVEGEVHVQNEQTLNILGQPFGPKIEVRFAPNAKIIVEQGGHLVIRSAYLTSLDPDLCPGTMWQGIEVWGSPNASSSDPIQGTITMWNAEIEHAHIGILLGARRMSSVCDFDPLLPNNNWFDLHFSGGVVNISGTSTQQNVFKQNGIDIKYLPKHINSMEAGSNTINYSRFLCCNETPPYSFLPLNDDHYDTSTPNSYPSSLNPWAGNANNYQGANCAISIENQMGFDIELCEFRFHEFGIRSINAQYNVYDNWFERIRFGVHNQNIGQNALMAQHIERNTFDQIAGVVNPNFAGIGISSTLGVNDYIYNNHFFNNGPSVTGCRNAIFSYFSSKYIIAENEIRRYEKGIIASWNMDGLIGAWQPACLGNQIRECFLGIETIGQNKLLNLKCNDHYPNSGVYDRNWRNFHQVLYWPLPPTYIIVTLGNQGTATMPNGPAGNSFNEPALKQIESDMYYQYIHHTEPLYTPVTTTQVDIPPTGVGPYGNSDAVSCSPPFPTSLPLPSVNFDVYPYSVLELLNNRKDSVNQILANIISDLDHGETQLLLNAIFGNAPPGQLKNILVSHSPLSDTVLIALMTEAPLSPGLFKQVMEKNLPVSLYVYLFFNEYISNLPPGIRNNLLNLQTDNPNAVTAESVRRIYHEFQMIYSDLFNRITILLNDTGDYRPDDIIQLLEYDNSDVSKQILVSTYISKGDLDSAAAKIASLPDDFWSHDFKEVQQIVLNLYQQDTTIYGIDSVGFAYLNDLAYKCPPNPGVAIAGVIVEMITGQPVPPCPSDLGNKNLIINANTQEFDESKESESLLGNNYPDPFTDETIIPYSVKEGSKGIMIIKDVTGRIITEIELKSCEVETTVNTIGWAEGMYIYTLKVDEEIIGSKKMILN
ncbi:MAG: hypothetical protein ABIJ97_01640, partial [Bacteroidota bacterium]